MIQKTYKPRRIRLDKGKPCPQRGNRYTAKQKYIIWQFIAQNWEQLQNEPQKVFTQKLGISMATIIKIIGYQDNYEKNKII